MEDCPFLPLTTEKPPPKENAANREPPPTQLPSTEQPTINS